MDCCPCTHPRIMVIRVSILPTGQHFWTGLPLSHSIPAGVSWNLALPYLRASGIWGPDLAVV